MMLIEAIVDKRLEMHDRYLTASPAKTKSAACYWAML